MSGWPRRTPMSSTLPTTSSWSPASYARTNVHSTQARAPSSTGAPLPAGVQPTPVNLSPPEMAKSRPSASWSSVRMLTQNAPAAAMRGQLVEFFPGASATSGGSSDSDVNAWQVKPTGWPPCMAVTIVTPVTKWPRTSRKRPASSVAAPVASRSSPPASTASIPPLVASLIVPLVVLGLLSSARPRALRRSATAEVDGQSFLGGQHAVETARIGISPGLAQESIEVVVGVLGVVVEQGQLPRAGFGRDVHRVGDGGVSPRGLGPVLLLGVLGVVDHQVGAVAQLEHRRVDFVSVLGGLVIAHERHGAVAGLDTEPERRADVRHLPNPHLRRSDGNHIVGHFVELNRPPELFHFDREERGLHDPVDDVMQGAVVLGRAEHVHSASLAQQRRAERKADDVVPVQVRQERRDLDGIADAVALVEIVSERAQARAQVEDDRRLVADLHGHTCRVAPVAHVALADTRARAPDAEECYSQRTPPLLLTNSASGPAAGVASVSRAP